MGAKGDAGSSNRPRPPAGGPQSPPTSLPPSHAGRGEKEIAFHAPFFLFFPFFLLKELSSASQEDPHHQLFPVHGGFTWVRCSKATSSQRAELAISCQRLFAALQKIRVTGEEARSSPKTGTGSFAWRSASRLANSSLSVFITPLFHTKRLMAMLTLTQSCLALKHN